MKEFVESLSFFFRSINFGSGSVRSKLFAKKRRSYFWYRIMIIRKKLLKPIEHLLVPLFNNYINIDMQLVP